MIQSIYHIFEHIILMWCFGVCSIVHSRLLQYIYIYIYYSELPRFDLYNPPSASEKTEGYGYNLQVPNRIKYNKTQRLLMAPRYTPVVIALFVCQLYFVMNLTNSFHLHKADSKLLCRLSLAGRKPRIPSLLYKSAVTRAISQNQTYPFQQMLPC